MRTEFFTKSDLFYKDYIWNAYNGDDPRVTGEPDSTLLNRKEGYEVLYFINTYARKNLFSQFSQFKKIEIMIRENVPSDIRSQKDIYEWIQKNWNNFLHT